MNKKAQCHIFCEECQSLNIRTDDQGYPFAWECMKYDIALSPESFNTSKDIK